VACSLGCTMLEEGVDKSSYLIQFRFNCCYFYCFYSKVRFHNSQYVNYIYTQVRKSEQEVDLRPITPSKIPVGAWRAKEERAITRALNGSLDSNQQSGELSVSPAPPSRIPKFSHTKLGPKYRAVQEKFPLYANHSWLLAD
jgi:hypothetical protein